MNETETQEKLLKSPLDTPELVSASVAEPLLTAKELVKTTPAHELKNLFGVPPETDLKPLGPEGVTNSVPSFPILPKKEPRETFTAFSEPAAEPKTGKKILRFLAGAVLIFVIIIIGFYIWGGELKNRSSTAETEILSPVPPL